jgi:hypothetical protein
MHNHLVEPGVEGRKVTSQEAKRKSKKSKEKNKKEGNGNKKERI